MNSTDERTITKLWYSLDHDELTALIQEVASQDEEGDGLNAAKMYSEARETLERNYQALLDAGHSESELAGMSLAELMNAGWIAQQLQGEAGNGLVGADLVKIIKGALQGKPIRVVSMLSGLSEKTIRNRLEGKTPITVNEAARLAVACGVSTGELLGIVDAEEVELLRLFRAMDERKRTHLLGLLS